MTLSQEITTDYISSYHGNTINFISTSKQKKIRTKLKHWYMIMFSAYEDAQ